MDTFRKPGRRRCNIPLSVVKIKVSLPVMMAYRGSRGLAPCSNLHGGQRQMVSLLPSCFSLCNVDPLTVGWVDVMASVDVLGEGRVLLPLLGFETLIALLVAWSLQQLNSHTSHTII